MSRLIANLAFASWSGTTAAFSTLDRPRCFGQVLRITVLLTRNTSFSKQYLHHLRSARVSKQDIYYLNYIYI